MCDAIIVSVQSLLWNVLNHAETVEILLQIYKVKKILQTL